MSDKFTTISFKADRQTLAALRRLVVGDSERGQPSNRSATLRRLITQEDDRRHEYMPRKERK